MTKLPDGWVAAELGDCLLSIVGGGTPPRSVPSYYAGSIPWFTVKDMKSLRPSDSEEHISETAIANSATNLIPPNTLICATRIALGRAMRPTVSCAINQDLKALFVGEGVDPDFLLHWFGAAEKVIQERGSGTTVSGIRLEILKAIPLLLPPSAEQRRIVQKLEELLSNLDAAVTELEDAQRKLAKYRVALLNSAVEGTLTSQWRAAHGEPKETGSEMLQRILSERRISWEQKQLARFAQQKKQPPSGWKANYPEPATPNLEGLPSLPEDWVWATIDQLSLALRYGSSAKTSDEDEGIPVLRMGNIQDGELDTKSLKYLPADHLEFPDLFLQDGDLLFNRTNSLELVGKTAVYRSEIKPCSYASYLIAVRFSPWCVPEVIAAFINSTHGRHWVKSVAIQQVGQANVNGTKLAGLAVPLAPMSEQNEIAKLLALHRRDAAQQEVAISEAIKQASTQRKSILKAAFSGELIPQNANDEPASVLIARIRAERDSSVRTSPIRKKKASKETAAVVRKLIEVLTEAGDWMPAQELFRRCGVADGAETDQVEALYDQLRGLDKAGRLSVEAVFDNHGRKLHDRLRLRVP